MNAESIYTPEKRSLTACGPGDFNIAAVGLSHGHIYGMCQNLVRAGATLTRFWDADPQKMQQFRNAFPDAKPASCEDEVLNDPGINLVATADIPNLRGPLGLRVLAHGKDFFTDKAPFTSLDQLESAREKVAATGRRWFVCYSDRVESECSVYAEQLIDRGVIGRVLHVTGFGPHRLNAASRPAWFFQRKMYGGIICDLGSHQVDQFLAFCGAADAAVESSRIANYHHPQYPELEDFGDANLLADNGATNYFRVDWFTPDGLGTWGDARAFIIGTRGYIELRKYIDIAGSGEGDQVYLVDDAGEHHFSVHGQVGLPFYTDLILDSLNGTDNAMPQAHTFKAAELCLLAQKQARRIA